ncbi:MAG: glycine--tRNA ligase [Crenarchaeota archaeon]|nr:glycine--tRNA ligase [Thermoproteota archaeon]MCR8454544.1 glycine--tRNA ligase [Thermoproteota archaeon]MCR8455018.1 glycine--tRNA ligase [Thermoproteota archaeon]MCR8463260.1 glycine--tRNA ligase [Thermoproteota archaeon]MCR8470466.1 glycine--tRNA ligase [Thermoproteota archaeon]
MEKNVSLDDIVNIAKRRGLIFPSSEIYGGLAGFYDYGPIGFEIKRRIIDDWWWNFVISRDDVYGISPAIILSPAVWKASGHVDEFIDILVECTKCKSRFKAETLLEDLGIKISDFSMESIKNSLRDNNARCPKCGGELSEPRRFNLMVEAHVGAVKDESSVIYLRPEIAQGMFINFKLISAITGAKLPFGIASYGKVFRNEIAPRGFIFRLREFEIAEIEYFIDPDEQNSCEDFHEVDNIEIKIWTKEEQKRNLKPKERKLGDAYNEGVFSSMWHAYWVGESVKWLESIGLSPENLRLREHLETELAHYAKQTFDIEYYFPYFGWKEIVGIANRTDYDLRRHSKTSGEKLYLVKDGKQFFPYCIEPSFGIDRIFLAVITEAYTVREDGKVILRLHPKVAPYDAVIVPLLKRPEFIAKAEEINRMLKRERLATYVDVSGRVGKAYVKADEFGVPYAITIDHETFENDTVTIRFRDTREQIRVPITELPIRIRELSKTTV